MQPLGLVTTNSYDIDAPLENKPMPTSNFSTPSGNQHSISLLDKKNSVQGCGYHKILEVRNKRIITEHCTRGGIYQWDCENARLCRVGQVISIIYCNSSHQNSSHQMEFVNETPMMRSRKK